MAVRVVEMAGRAIHRGFPFGVVVGVVGTHEVAAGVLHLCATANLTVESGQGCSGDGGLEAGPAAGHVVGANAGTEDAIGPVGQHGRRVHGLLGAWGRGATAPGGVDTKVVQKGVEGAGLGDVQHGCGLRLLVGCRVVGIAYRVLGCGSGRLRWLSTLGAVTGDLGPFDFGDLVAAPLTEVDVMVQVSAAELWMVDVLLLFGSGEHEGGAHAQQGLGVTFGVRDQRGPVVGPVAGLLLDERLADCLIDQVGGDLQGPPVGVMQKLQGQLGRQLAERYPLLELPNEELPAGVASLAGGAVALDRGAALGLLILGQAGLDLAVTFLAVSFGGGAHQDDLALFPDDSGVALLAGMGFRVDLDLGGAIAVQPLARERDRKSTRLNSSHITISYAVFCLKKKKKKKNNKNKKKKKTKINK